MRPIVFDERPKPPVKWKGRDTGSVEIGSLRNTGINWSKEIEWLYRRQHKVTENLGCECLYYARRPKPAIFRITCFVNAVLTPRVLLFNPLPARHLASAGRAFGEREGVEGWQGEPSIVLYPGGSSSSRSAKCSWRLASPALLTVIWSADLACNWPRSHLPASIPKSRRPFSSSWVSSRKSTPTKTPNARTTAHTRLGSKNGNWSKSVPRAKNLGKDSQGWARAPPSAGPRIDLHSGR